MHFKPYPQFFSEEHCQDLVNKQMKRPGKLAEYCLYGVLDNKLAANIYVEYAGYLNVSDEFGNVTFPYEHNRPSVKLVITNRITPIFMADNTIHHWELDPGTPATMYSVERKLDEDLKLYYWETKPAELPENKRIPLDSIIILAHPKNIEVPVGARETNESPHLVLPDVFVKKGNNYLSQSLYMLNLRHLFKPIRFDVKKESQRYIKQLSI